VLINYRVATGQGKLEKIREFEWSEKGQGKIFFGKVRENEMLQLVKDLLSRFVKRDVIDSLVTCNDVTSFDTNDAAKHNSAIDLGFSADRIFRSEGFKKKKVRTEIC